MSLSASYAHLCDSLHPTCFLSETFLHLLVKGGETHHPNHQTTHHTTMKKAFFLLGACSLLTLFSSGKISAEAVGTRGVIKTDCGTIYYFPDGSLTPEEIEEMQLDLSELDCDGIMKKDDDVWPDIESASYSNELPPSSR